MKIIFLDIDGVLNTWGHENATYLKYHSHCDPILLSNLEKILEFFEDARIVISSSWGWEAIELFKENEFAYLHRIIDVTPREKRWRGEQIKQWLDNHLNAIDSYIVIEDEIIDVCGEYCNLIPVERVVEIDHKRGLTEDKIKEVIEKLR